MTRQIRCNRWPLLHRLADGRLQRCQPAPCPPLRYHLEPQTSAPSADQFRPRISWASAESAETQGVHCSEEALINLLQVLRERPPTPAGFLVPPTILRAMTLPRSPSRSETFNLRRISRLPRWT